MALTSWVWFGNAPIVNTVQTTAPTNAQAASLNGRSAEGVYDAGPPPSGMQTIVLDGTTPNAGNTFNHRYQTGGNTTPSTFSYTTPSGTAVTGSRLTGVYQTQVTLVSQDGVEQTNTGFIMQMTNGDLFFRPSSVAISQ